MQSNAVLMGCILLAASAIVRGRWWRSAWLLAAPIYIKLWPAVVAGLLGVHWPRKLIARMTLACAALAAVPFLTKAPAEVVKYYHDWVTTLAARQATADRFAGYRDAWTIWEQFHTPVNKQAYFASQVAAGLAVFGWSLWLCKQQRPTAEFIIYTLSAWAGWQLLFGPGSERLTYLIVSPLATWAVIDSYLERRNFKLAVIAYTTTFLLGSGGAERTLIHWLPAATALQPIGLVVFAAWLVRHAASHALPNDARAPRLVHPSIRADVDCAVV